MLEPWTPDSAIDQLVSANWRKLGIAPAPLCPDDVFLRRVFLDSVGTLPSAQEAAEFLSNRDPDKRAALIDRLLDREEFADYGAMRWSDVLRAGAVALTFMGMRTEKWPKERVAGMAAFFSRIGYKETGEWKEEIVYPSEVSPGARYSTSGAAYSATAPTLRVLQPQ